MTGSLPAALVRAWCSATVAMVWLALLEVPLVAARTGGVPLLYFVSHVALASVVALALAGLVGLGTVVQRAGARGEPTSVGAIARGGGWGLAVGGGGVLVLQPWDIYDPYRLDLVLLAGTTVAGATVAGLDARGRPRWALAALAVVAIGAWLADTFVQRHHFARLHDVAAYLAIVAATAIAWRTWPRWRGRRRPVWIAGAALAANLVALADVRALATTGVFHGVQHPKLLRVARGLTDFDRDGFSALIGGGDCNDLDARVHPGRCEIADNGRDDNCNGLADPAPPALPAYDWASGGREPPDIYVVIVDTLRADYGGQPRPPAFERLARQSLDFEVAYTAYPSTYRGLLAFAQGRPWRYVGTERDNLLTLLAHAGWDVALWHADTRARAGDGPRLLADAPHTVEHFAMNKKDKPAMTAAIVDDALAELDTDGPPRVRWLHLDDPHYPWTRGPGTSDPKAGYLAEIAHVDAELTRLLDGLDATARGREAVIIVLGDHGEEFGEHGGTLHGGTLYEEVTRVPLMMRLPGLAPRTITTVASTLDVLPTLLHYLGLPDPGGLFGHDFLSVDPVPATRVLSEIERRPGTLSVAHRATMQMVRRGHDKLILDVDRNVYQLFDLAADPQERDAVTAERPADARALLEALAVWQDRPDCRPPMMEAGGAE